jgi:hypothetical protein
MSERVPVSNVWANLSKASPIFQTDKKLEERAQSLAPIPPLNVPNVNYIGKCSVAYHSSILSSIPHILENI